MDYKDYQKGASDDFFWFKAKKGLIEILVNKLTNKGRLKILNVGAGTGDDVPILSKFGDVHVIDKDKKALDLIPDKLISEKVTCDACDMHYPDHFFDVVVAFDVLEHIRDDALTINEIHRVLKPKGFFIFTVPAFNFLYSAHDRNLNHIRRYNKKTMKNILSDFKCIELGYWLFILFIPLALQRLLKRNEHDNDSHFVKLPKLINNFCGTVMKIENWIIKHGMRLPVGSTIYGIYQKD